MEGEIFMIAVVGSLLIGLIIGFLGQRSRMCFIGGFRDFLMVGDKALLRGAIAFFATAWVTILLANGIGTLVPALSDAMHVKYVVYPAFISAAISKFGLISLFGGLALGFFSTLSEGCPLRQHVMSGQGRVDSMLYLLGFYLGIIVYYLLTVKWIAAIM